MMRIVGTSLLVFASWAACAQTPEAPLSFDVASLKPTATENTEGRVMRRMAGGPGSSDPGAYTFNNVTLKLLVEMAYNLKEYQVEGPDWIDSTGYDLIAKMPPGTTKDQAARMMQTLLAERFKLVFHRETRQMPVFALVVGKGGSKLKEVEVPATPVGPPPGPPDGRGGGPRRMGSGPGVQMTIGPNGSRMAGYMTMAQFTDLLTRRLERPVLDETELKATYDVDITWMPDDMDPANARMAEMAAMAGAPPGGPGGRGGDAPRGAAEPALTLAQALQEKLGLKLETRKSAAEILIIDHADRTPVEN
jgi:uncharacterized protein (TIGR03435 family)